MVQPVQVVLAEARSRSVGRERVHDRIQGHAFVGMLVAVKLERGVVSILDVHVLAGGFATREVSAARWIATRFDPRSGARAALRVGVRSQARDAVERA